MSAWFDYSSTPMVFSGAGTWRDVLVDLWDSVKTCTLFGKPPVPCTRLATRTNTADFVANQFAHQKAPNSFESDWISFDWWAAFTAETATLPLPTSWVTKCYNTENGLLVSPEQGYVSTPQGMDNFTLALRTPPIVGLPPVKVTFSTGVSCNNCVQFVLADGSSANNLVFTANNWNIPVPIFLKYLTDGETYFYIVAVGGGYDVPHVDSEYQTTPQTSTRSASLRVLTCVHGVPGWGCNNA